jgi:hypothetical protein
MEHGGPGLSSPSFSQSAALIEDRRRGGAAHRRPRTRPALRPTRLKGCDFGKRAFKKLLIRFLLSFNPVLAFLLENVYESSEMGSRTREEGDLLKTSVSRDAVAEELLSRMGDTENYPDEHLASYQESRIVRRLFDSFWELPVPLVLVLSWLAGVVVLLSFGAAALYSCWLLLQAVA